jgi:hypothetical protein
VIVDAGTNPPKLKRVRKAKKEPKPIENLCGLLERICELLDCGVVPAEQVSSVRLHQVFDAIGRRAYGPLLLLLGLIGISPLTAVPGATWAIAGLTLVVALQLTLGAQIPWMPPALMNIQVSSSGLVKAVDALRPAARRIDWFLKPRLTFLAAMPFVIVIGLCIMAAAAITFPLGFIPFAPLVPGMAIVLFGLGLVAKDGLMLLGGMGFVAGAGYMAREIVSGLVSQGMELLARMM